VRAEGFIIIVTTSTKLKANRKRRMIITNLRVDTPQRRLAPAAALNEGQSRAMAKGKPQTEGTDSNTDGGA